MTEENELILDQEEVPQMDAHEVLNTHTLWTHPEILLPAGHKANDRHMKALAKISQAIHSARRNFTKTKYALALDDLATGMLASAVCKKHRMASQTLTKIRNSHNGKTYIYALQCYKQGMAGPSLLMRQQMLWRIATENEKKRPQISIAAIKQIDTQEGIGIAKDISPSEGIQIIIQQFGDVPGTPVKIDGRQTRTIEGESEVVQDDS